MTLNFKLSHYRCVVGVDKSPLFCEDIAALIKGEAATGCEQFSR
jgi:hypothetical protein